MRVVTFAGGIGGARFLTGMRAVLDGADDRLTAVVNTGDDVTLHGLRICPDLDTVMYTLGGGIDPERGWGRAAESWVVKSELAAYGVSPDWFGLGDRDVATHLVRTRMLDAGYPLSEVTEALCRRWRPGVRILPMTDSRVETHVLTDAPADEATTGPTGTATDTPPDTPAGESAGPLAGHPGGSVTPGDRGRRAIHFQEWWVRHHAAIPARSFVLVGIDDAEPAPGVLDAIAGADLVVFAPSNPVVSIGPILGVPGIREALVAGTAPVVGLSPIIGGAPVRGMADACLTAIGVDTSAEAVGRLYGPRSDGGVLDRWLVDPVDAATQVPGVQVTAVPLLMSDPHTTAAMARAALTP